MATAPSQHPVTILPPSVQKHGSPRFDECAFAARRRYPVEAAFHGGDSWTSTGIDFSDYMRCGTQQRKQSGERRKPAPEWSLKPDMLRALVVRTMELRAGILKPAAGTDAERLARAQARIALKIPAKEESLTRLCRRYVAMRQDPTTMPSSLEKAAQVIEGIDTELRIWKRPDRGAALLVGVVSFYYSRGMDSVGVANELGIKPPAVRRQIWAMHRVWERIQKETPWCQAISGWKRTDSNAPSHA